MSDEDPYRWLEDVTGAEQLDWVRARNAEALAELAGGERFGELRARLREVYDAEDRIPWPTMRGEHLYNFWQDAAHPRGLWRRTTPERYRGAAPDWEVLLDVDALAAEEDENWVWHGAAVLRPGYRRALVELSRGGADATVVREFDLSSRAFVDGGFTLPEAKNRVSWAGADALFVGTDFGPGSLTDSGYPRVVKLWRRGTDLDAAVTVFEGEPSDVLVAASHDHTPGYERDFVIRAVDFYRTLRYLRTADGDLVTLDVPEDAETSVHRDWLLIAPRSAWTVGGVTHPAGTLLAARFDDYLAGDRALRTVFEPDPHTALGGYTWTRGHLLLTALRDVRPQLWALSPDEDWRRTELPAADPLGAADILGTDPDSGDDYLLAADGFTTPETLRFGTVGGPTEVLKTAPAFFDTTGMRTEQLFATSADGTRVPYFVVRPPGEPGPVLLSAYGGFEVPRLPGYSGVIGRGWLARGGSYVLANIRGGGEYGPDWHTGAILANRHLVFEDLAAVATDLHTRGIATPDTLGMEGGSNGGLLAGVMLTRYPQLFGAVVVRVPLLDMRRYHQLLAGASWMAEYGDPDDPEQWAFIGAYSPYHNVHSGQSYPPTLVLTSTRDDRVHPGHARKMVARMHEQGHDVRYYENIEGGHGAAADNAQRAFHWALIFEFLTRNLTQGG